MSLKDKLSNILKVSEDEYYDVPDSEAMMKSKSPRRKSTSLFLVFRREATVRQRAITIRLSA